MTYWNRYLTLSVAFIFSLLSGCTYRFTNLALQAPANVNSIAVEAIYDTSREAVPHELLWKALQTELIKAGRVNLSSIDQADAILRVHLKKAAINPQGTPIQESIDRDPDYENRSELSPDAYKNLNIAGSYTTSENLSWQIEVEIYHRFEKRVIFNKNYSISGSFRSFQASNISQTQTGFLMYEEGLEARFEQQAKQIANRIVTDFLLRSKAQPIFLCNFSTAST